MFLVLNNYSKGYKYNIHMIFENFFLKNQKLSNNFLITKKSYFLIDLRKVYFFWLELIAFFITIFKNESNILVVYTFNHLNIIKSLSLCFKGTEFESLVTFVNLSNTKCLGDLEKLKNFKCSLIIDFGNALAGGKNLTNSLLLRGVPSISVLSNTVQKVDSFLSYFLNINSFNSLYFFFNFLLFLNKKSKKIYM